MAKLPKPVVTNCLGLLAVLTVSTCCTLNHNKYTRIELENVIRLVIDKKPEILRQLRHRAQEGIKQLPSLLITYSGT